MDRAFSEIVSTDTRLTIPVAITLDIPLSSSFAGLFTHSTAHNRSF